MTVSKACGKVGALLPAYAAGALVPAEMRAVATHLGQCAACRQQLREWKLIIPAANVAASGPPPSPDSLDQIRARIDASEGSRQHSDRGMWTKMTGGHYRGWPPPSSSPGGDDVHAPCPFRRGRSSVAEIAVVGLLVVILGGGLISRGWWGQIFPDDDSTTTLSEPTDQIQPAEQQQPTEPDQQADQSEPTEQSEPTDQSQSTLPVAGSTPSVGGLIFSSELSNVATHPGASLLLGRLTIEPGSGTGLQAEGQINLLVETGIVSGLLEGPAIVTHGPGGELAGQTEELEEGGLVELLASDHILLPVGTSIELMNNGDVLVRALEIRIQAPGPPLNLTNGVQYRQLAQATAQLLPSGQVDFSLIEGGLTAGISHAVDGPAVFFVESGTVEIADANADLEIKGNDEPDIESSLDASDPAPNDQVSGGGWFSLDAGENASLMVANGPVAYLELLFDSGDAESSGIARHVLPPQTATRRSSSRGN